MIRRVSLALIFASLLGIGVAYASAFFPGGAPVWAPWAMAVGTATAMVGIMALGAVRDGRLGRLWFPFVFVLLVLVGGFGVVLSLPPADPADPTLWLGLPPRAAVVLFGIGLLPLVAVPVAYALTFDQMTLSQADLDRVRVAAGATGRSPVAGHPSPDGRATSDDRGPTDERARPAEVGQ